MTVPLSAPMQVGFDYTRSLGPTLSSFMTGLAARRVLGSRDSTGRVHVPPLEYDPVTLAPTGELVDVADVGTVISWSWMSSPLPGQPLGEPFAWALIKLDGADTPLLHAIDAPQEAVQTGMRVRVRWADSRVGSIRDIACFEPAPSPLAQDHSNFGDIAALPRQDLSNIRETATSDKGDKVAMVTTPIHLSYEHTASPEESRYLRALAEGRITGQRCPVCAKVYVPPRGACPTDGVPTTDEVALPDTGTITTFCIVNVPFPGQRTKPPYVHAAVLLDGADIPFSHLILGCAPDEVRMGMRVRAVWKPRDQWATTPQNIDHFEPSGEPDAAYETYADHL